MITKRTPEETAIALIESNVSIETYQELQDRRKDRLRLWKERKIDVLIKNEKELIAYGEEVLKFMKSKS
jgi:hypothetical protein